MLWSTLVSLMAVTGSQLWQAGYQQWAFLLFFATLWVFFTVCLANDRFNEQSGVILARVIDENVDDLLERIRQLEDSVAMIQEAQSEDAPNYGRQIAG